MYINAFEDVMAPLVGAVPGVGRRSRKSCSQHYIFKLSANQTPIAMGDEKYVVVELSHFKGVTMDIGLYMTH